MKKIFCIIPSYNEEKTISKVINQVEPIVSQIVVVDDGSTDGSYQLAKKTRAVVLRHIINRGQGAALKTGTEYAIKENADIIVHFDADGQFIAGDIAAIIKPLVDGQADIVFGSRFLEKNHTLDIPRGKKYFIIPLARLINKVFLGVNLTDPQSGFRAMTAAAAKRLDWRQDRMAHCSEILQQASQKKLRTQEVPIKIVYHNFGQRFGDGIRILVDLFLAKFID